MPEAGSATADATALGRHCTSAMCGNSTARIDLQEARLDEVHLSRADLHDADLSSSRAALTQMAGVNFSSAKLKDVSFFRSELKGANLKNSDLSCAHFNQVNAEPAYGGSDEPDTLTIFSGASMGGFRAFSSNFEPAEFNDADLSTVMFGVMKNSTRLGIELARIHRSTEFRDCNLKKASFQRVKAHRVGFQRGNLQGADFSEARLTDVIFDTVDLAGANFSGVDLSSVRFENATYTENTIWPPSFEPSTLGPKLMKRSSSSR